MSKKRRGPGRPKTAAHAALGQIVTARFNKELIGRLDAWRAKQEAEPTRGHAVRVLTAFALTAKGF